MGIETVKDTARAFSEEGRSIARHIDDAILSELPDDYELLTIQAHRIRACNRDHNNWYATDLHDTDGECYDGSGRFWFCGSKMCPYCLAKQTRRNRKNLRKSIDAQKLIVGENLHFLTLTMPNEGLDLLEARSLMNYAWVIFRKRKWFRSRVIGGCKSEEFTLTKRGFHYHLHAIVRSRYIEYHAFRAEWTSALRVAFERKGMKLSIATSDKLAIANCVRVRSIDDAVNEVAKYVTKSTSWKRVTSTALLDLCRIRRWPRMFELFGSFSQEALRVSSVDEASVEEQEERSNKAILDTTSISDGSSATNWRTAASTMFADRYLAQFEQSLYEHWQARVLQLKKRYAYATFRQLRPTKTESIESVLARLAKLRQLWRETLNNSQTNSSRIHHESITAH
jgi:hypothetical protein